MPVPTVGEAIRALGATTYDVAVIDHHLPDAASDELLDDIRANAPGWLFCI